jgi:hypothetical protein
VGAVFIVVPVVGCGVSPRSEEAASSAATALNRDGGMMLGLSGQTMRNTLGWSYAEAMGWVVDDHGQIKRGSQNPAPSYTYATVVGRIT